MYTAPRWGKKKEKLTFLSLGTASMPVVYPEMGASKELGVSPRHLRVGVVLYAANQL